jgi:squalene synthase HpnC
VSRLLPKELRDHFCTIYSFCRWADDLADEMGDPEQSKRLLDWWENQLTDCYASGRASPLCHPVFIALEETIAQFEIPAQPFHDLVSAFRQDQRVTRYETVDDVLDYCRRSANPVGRLILSVGQVNDAESERLSDHICTGLQLANFCQDVANDWDRGRIYLPRETLRAVGYTEKQFVRREFNAAFREAMRIEVDRAEKHLRAGLPLIDRMPNALRFDVSLFAAGGLSLLEAIRKQDYNVWIKRPTLSKFDKAKIATRQWRRLRQRSTALQASYDACRAEARRSASSFAWAFWLLPRKKRMAMNALYAFLRRTDDLGDNKKPAAVRRADLEHWRTSFDRALVGTFDDPLLPAVADAVHAFSIPSQYITDVIDGVAMDCVERDSNHPQFATFAELEHYCELVASAVGMACIHVWGFHDQRALEPARQCGVAFQLTNILRDLRDDAEQGRIYLPKEDLDRANYSVEELRRGVVNERFAELLRFEISRTEDYYRRATELHQYLDPAGERMFGAMLNTYSGLLDKIKRPDTNILSRRVRLSRWRKLQIAGRSLLLRPRWTLGDPTIEARL